MKRLLPLAAEESLEWLSTRGVSAKGSLASGDTSDVLSHARRRILVDEP
jgi:hypothetical protein